MSEVHRMLDLSVKLQELINQIEINDYKDSHGHELKKCAAYVRVKEMIDV